MSLLTEFALSLSHTAAAWARVHTRDVCIYVLALANCHAHVFLCLPASAYPQAAALFFTTLRA